MKIIYNKFIPFKGFKALTIFNLVFVRKEQELTQIDLQHEKIHCCQQYECMFAMLAVIGAIKLFFHVPPLCALLTPLTFFIIYIINYLVNIASRAERPYRDILFEKEAYLNQENFTYLKSRKIFAWIKM